MGVVFIHAYSLGESLLGNNIPVAQHHWLTIFLQNFCSQGLARIAVPTLFFISGYLFFAKGTLSVPEYRQKLKARVNSLLIPFLLWNLFTLVVIAAIQARQQVDPTYQHVAPLPQAATA